MDELYGCDIVFADPDKGLVLDDNFRWNGADDGWQHIPLHETIALSEPRNRLTVIYHNNTHPIGGIQAEIEYWMDQLPKCIHTFLCRRFNSRMFFVLNADDADAGALEQFVEDWREAEFNANRAARLSELIHQG